MARKKKEDYKWFDLLVEILIGLGFFYLLYKLIHSDEPINESNRKVGINGPPRIRKFVALTLEDKEPYLEDILKLSSFYQKLAFKAVTIAQHSDELEGNWIKFFKNDIITGELIKGQIRIFFYRHKNGIFYTVHVFLKKSNETDESNKITARNRIRRFLSNK